MPPVDPDFARLFRDEAAPLSPEPQAVPEPPAPPQEPVDSAPTSASTDTGRLFRSQGVTGSSTALLAVTSHQGAKLRTLSRSATEPEPAPQESSAPADGPVLPPRQADHTQFDAAPVATASASDPGSRGSRAAASGITATAVYLLIIGVTVIVAFANALLLGGKVGWPTGLALLIVTVFCALKVRRDDDITVIITPPIAFFIAAITAAQLFIGESQRSLINRAVVMFFTLAENWVWIIGSTIVAAVIVIVRRRR